MERIQKEKRRGYSGVFNEFFINNTQRYVSAGNIAIEKMQNWIKMFFTVYLLFFGKLKPNNCCKLSCAIVPEKSSKSKMKSKINHDKQWVIL